MDAPLIPYFCGGYDDSVEIVLNQCIVRVGSQGRKILTYVYRIHWSIVEKGTMSHFPFYTDPEKAQYNFIRNISL
uniref:Tyrosine-protein phosphatase domain-containing protein n=1 Tax=Heterorhabditis bacteriophora TaxID=37862 RepID=A0A1I7WZI9_HETBA